jgi:hypothetical protein
VRTRCAHDTKLFTSKIARQQVPYPGQVAVSRTGINGDAGEHVLPALAVDQHQPKPSAAPPG